MLNRSPIMRTFIGGLALAVVLCCAPADLAQSGRKARKPAPAPAEPEPTPAPTPTPSSERPKPRLTLLVGLDRSDGFSNIPLYAYEGVLRSITERLEASSSVRVTGAQADMARSDAIKKAKAETEAYVVWVKLDEDSMTRDTRSPSNLDNLIIEYSVLAPATAKQTTSGRSYTQSQRNRGILSPRTSSIYGDRYLILAAQEAADRILAHFQIRAPATRGP